MKIVKFVGNRINNIHLRDLLPVVSSELEVDFVQAAIAYFYGISAKVKGLFSV